MNQPEKKKKRKSVIITKWFGESSSSEDSESEMSPEWTEIDRKKTRIEKKRRLDKRRKERKLETAKKVEHMAGIGPIYVSDATKRMDSKIGFEAAKRIVLKEFLAKYLGYNMEELQQLKIEDTKFATSGEDILYVALVDQDQIKELYIRRAESRNDNVIVRNYIPPNFHERFVHLNRICAEKRKADSKLKTQLRFEHGDIQIYIKYKDEDSGIKLVKMGDFTDIKEVPPFNHSLRWKRFMDRPPRRKVYYNSDNPTKGKGNVTRSTVRTDDHGPATGQKDTELPVKTLTRQHSKETEVQSKRARLHALSSQTESSDSSSSASDEDMTVMDTEIDATEETTMMNTEIDEQL